MKSEREGEGQGRAVTSFVVEGRGETVLFGNVPPEQHTRRVRARGRENEALGEGWTVSRNGRLQRGKRVEGKARGRKSEYESVEQVRERNEVEGYSI